ncbi:MAG: ABC transporter permease [Candidatus Gracilibacteria bacterium]|nr:ABC transporter permease [Candidatus Gracilibacteria bacterium]
MEQRMKSQNNYFQLFWTLALTDFKLRYNGSILGFLWALLKPLMIFLILNFVFSNIFAAGDPYFSLRLLIGIILWTFFSEGTSTGMTSLFSKAHIITKTYIPRWIIVLSSSANVLITFFINLLILAVFFVLAGVYPSPVALLMFAIYCILTFIVILAFSFLTSTLFLKFRDLNQIWEVMLTAGFYACPIIYPLDVIPVNLHWLLLLNPMTFIIQYSKIALVDNQFINPVQHGIYIVVALVSLFLGYAVFRANVKNAAENI